MPTKWHWGCVQAIANLANGHFFQVRQEPNGKGLAAGEATFNHVMSDAKDTSKERKPRLRMVAPKATHQR